jgi:hypothetical protein
MWHGVVCSSLLMLSLAACGDSGGGSTDAAPTSDAAVVDAAPDADIDGSQLCAPGATESCYTGPTGTSGVGACVPGTRTCNADGLAWGACQDEVTPTDETCTTAVDDDCDGMVNEEGEGCECQPNATTACYSGPDGTQGVGVCAAGTHTCNAMGTGFGDCTGETLPATETCTTAVDDDCDGQINESGAGCVCVPNSIQSCYSGAPGTQGIGLCKAGVRTCNALGTAYGACTGEVVPASENCSNNADDDCDGQVNEGCPAS